MRRPMWFGAGVAFGVGGTLWAQLRLKRFARRASALLAPTLASEVPDRAAAPRRPAAATAARRAAGRAAARTGTRVVRAALRAALAPKEADPPRR